MLRQLFDLNQCADVKTIKISNDLHKTLKVRATVQGKSLQDVIEEALTTFLRNHPLGPFEGAHLRGSKKSPRKRPRA